MKQQQIRDTPHDSASQTRASLLVRLRDGADGDAWRTFVAVYTPLVYGFARARGLQDADAADVAQEVLGEVARCIRSFEYRPETGRFRDWLGLITRRRLGRFYHRQSRRPAGLPDDLATDADPEWASAFQQHLLETALSRIEPEFEPATWQAFTRVWLNGQLASSVADEVGVSVTAVYIAKSRALKRLREEVLALAEDVPQFVPLH
ncbi:MAG: sigma-70 family RNA polymerase sigma factor [Gemmataceae bacterium]|nr:sigma-70 family RNA polymerase sigma factor [Gemmataceae bacterium]